MAVRVNGMEATTGAMSACPADGSGRNTATVVLGVQFGDEGKGKIVDLLCQNANIVCRCQGGNNAGHTVVVENTSYDFHLLPSGFINPSCMNVLGNGVVINLGGLFDEIEKNEKKGLTDLHKRLFISSRAHLVFQFHLLADVYEEELRGSGKKIGTTMKGIGPTYSCKASRNSLRVADLLDDFNTFSEKYRDLSNNYCKRYPKMREELTTEDELKKHKVFRERIKPLVRDTVKYLSDELNCKSKKVIIVEGANATMLDLDFGTYPMVTSSNSSIGGVFTGLGIPPRSVGDIYGVCKAYTTRVGEGCFPTQMEKELDEVIRQKGHEFGVTTGRARRCGWLDMVMLKYANRINGFTAIALTKLDILDDCDPVKIGISYKSKKNGMVMDDFPASQNEFEDIEVEYLELPGWKSPTTHVRKFDDLPQNAKNYIRKFEELMGVKIKWIGVGSARDAIITVY